MKPDKLIVHGYLSFKSYSLSTIWETNARRCLFVSHSGLCGAVQQGIHKGKVIVGRRTWRKIHVNDESIADRFRVMMNSSDWFNCNKANGSEEREVKQGCFR